MFAVRPYSTQVEQLSGSSIYGKLSALVNNIRFGLNGTNARAYWLEAWVTMKKVFQDLNLNEI